MKLFDNIKLLTKIQVYISILFTIMFLVSGAFLYFVRKNQIKNDTEQRVDSQLDELEDVINIYQKRDKDILNQAAAFAENKINEYSDIEEVEDKDITIKAVEPFTNKPIELVVKEWEVDGFPLLNNYLLVDELSKVTKLEVSIYQKSDKGYVNVSTSILSRSKERQTGDIILNSSPIVKAIEQGTQYIGRIYHGNAWYLTSYKPILVDNKIKGFYYLGIRERIGRALQGIFEGRKFLKSGYPFVMSKNGILLIHPNKQNEDYSETIIYKKLTDSKSIRNTIEYRWPDNKNGEIWVTHAKFHPDSQSYICITFPKKELYRELLIYSLYGLIGFVLFFILLQFVFSLSNKALRRRLKRLRLTLTHLAEGQDASLIHLSGEKEFNLLADKINVISSRLGELAKFANGLVEDNFSQTYPKSFINDSIGEALIKINDKLNEAMYNEHIRQKEDKLRIWESEGLSKFVNILQRNRENLEELCYELISSLVEYLNADLGALFFINSDKLDDIYLEQMATYAFEQKRLINKKIYPDQGLIGRIFNEKETIYLTEIPEGYINITSGLGESPPKNLLIVPLLINREVYGAIEIASFNIIKGYQIEFIEKIGENIASTINNVLVNNKTKLLLEQSREQSELLSNQEEEMRRNLVELKNIQKESDANLYAQRDLFKSLEHILMLVELSPNGEILSVNERVLEFFAMSRNSLVGKHYSDYSNFVPVDEYKNLITSWNKIENNEEVQTELKVKSGKGKMVNVMVNMVPEFEKDQIQKIVILGIELKS